ncbi:hypothetical protein KKF91_00025 [Myxococcota bacterium]|nr:hypothetical protein [Myxococcota bacterium]MBU1428921.1 hypothetical protein [Myxococcota bacterium]MBU1898984.1 hypothetical protein [Myxococcota bacterium]
MSAAWLALALLSGPLPGPEGLWAGYQEVAGQRDVAVLGEVKMRNRAWFLARWRQEGERWIMEQEVCDVDFDPVLGSQVRLPLRALRRLPRAKAVFERWGKSWRARGWRSGWGAEDIDEDGAPGVTMVIDAPMCGGRLHVASDTITQAELRPEGQGWSARLRVRVAQKILGADSLCLGQVASDAQDRLRGFFRLAPVPEGSACADWARADWPAPPTPPRW